MSEESKSTGTAGDVAGTPAAAAPSGDASATGSTAAAATDQASSKPPKKAPKPKKAPAAPAKSASPEATSELRTVAVQLPLGTNEPSGYMSTSFDVTLHGSQSTTLKRLADGFRERGLKIHTTSDVIRHLLDAIGNAFAPAAETPAE